MDFFHSRFHVGTLHHHLHSSRKSKMQCNSICATVFYNLTFLSDTPTIRAFCLDATFEIPDATVTRLKQPVILYTVRSSTKKQEKLMFSYCINERTRVAKGLGYSVHPCPIFSHLKTETVAYKLTILPYKVTNQCFLKLHHFMP